MSRPRRPSPTGSGSSVGSAGRPSSARRWKRRSTSVRSATITTGSRPGSGWSSSSTPESFEPFNADLTAADPLGFVDVKPYKQQDRGGATQERRERRMPHRRRLREGSKGRARRDGLRVPRRLDGFGGRREARPGDRTCDRPRPAAGDRVLFRRGSDAGVRLLPDADGEDLRGARSLRRGGRPVHLGAGRSDHGRRDGEFRDAGRRDPRRARTR